MYILLQWERGGGNQTPIPVLCGPSPGNEPHLTSVIACLPADLHKQASYGAHQGNCDAHLFDRAPEFSDSSLLDRFKKANLELI